MAALEQFLGSAFTSAELRRWVHDYLGPGIHGQLPGEVVAHTELVFQTVRLIERHGRLDGRLFESLREVREHRAVEIADLAMQLSEELREPRATRMPKVQSRRWVLLAVFTGTSCVLTVVLIWAPHTVPDWLGGVLAAVIAGAGVALAPLLFRDPHDQRHGSHPVGAGYRPDPQDGAGTTRTEFARRALLPGHDEEGSSAPIAVTVTLSDVSFVRVPDAHGDSGIDVPASGHSVQLAVEALDGRTVILSGLRPVVLSRQLPSGCLVQHAGALPVRRFTVLLDDDPPLLTSRGRNLNVFPFKVAADDPEVFELRVETERWDVAWVLELDWICAGHQGTSRIDLAGHPFRCMARPPGPTFKW